MENIERDKPSEINLMAFIKRKEAVAMAELVYVMKIIVLILGLIVCWIHGEKM